MPKPTILLLGILPPPYFGSSIVTKTLLDSNLRNLFSLIHLNTNTHKSLTSIGKIEIERLWKSIVIFFKLAALIVQKKPDLVHIPLSQSTIGFFRDSLFVMISKFFNRKVVLHLHGSNFKNWLNNSPYMMRVYVKYILKMVQGVIVLGKNLRYIFTDFFTENKIFVVPNGANYNLPQIEKEKNITKILYLSNLQPSKGIEDITKAFIILKKKYNINFYADVVGQWRDKLTEKICTRIVKDNNLPVLFYPPVFNRDKFHFFLNSDIFVFTPRAPEGQPLAVLEAIASSLPIISTDQGAITDMVIDGTNGFIVDTYNPCQIAEKIKYLIENPEIRTKMGQASRKHYLENFTEDKMVENLEYCFNSVLNKK